MPAHGCVPDGGFVADASVTTWMITSLQIGGHSEHLDDPTVRQLFELALSDQMPPGLPSRFLRRDRTVTGQLYQRITSLRT